MASLQLPVKYSCQMLVPNCIGAYRRESFSSPPPTHVIGSSGHKIIALTEYFAVKQNFFSLTVCTLDQYLQNYSIMLVLLS